MVAARTPSARASIFRGAVAEYWVGARIPPPDHRRLIRFYSIDLQPWKMLLQNFTASCYMPTSPNPGDQIIKTIWVIVKNFPGCDLFVGLDIGRI